MKKVLTILGARPQFIKAAALSRVILEKNRIEEKIIHTGQHFDKNMSDVFFSEMGIPEPDYKLQVSGLNHGAMTGRMMEQIEKIVEQEKPSAVLVYGDTNSTLAGALVGAKLHVPVIHIEAGLRSFNMNMPEEINRILTDRVSSLLLCPTKQAIENLSKEGFQDFKIEIQQVGDVMEDAAIYYSKVSKEKSNVISQLDLQPGFYNLLTCHRAENTNDEYRLKNILDGVNQIAKDIPVVWPVHPRLAKRLSSFTLHKQIKVVDPVGYFDMLQLIQNSEMILTDSGGLQKEAYFFDKYCVTMRDQTEWIELVEGGYNKIVGANKDKIYAAFRFFCQKPFVKAEALYGGGNASVTIENLIYNFLRV